MPKSLKELREEQAQVMTQAREAFDSITDKTEESRAKELEEQHDRAMDKFDELQKQIDRQERFEQANDQIENRNRNDRKPKLPDGSTKPDQQDEDPLVYRDVFKLAMQFGAAQLSEEARSVFMEANRGAPVIEHRALTTGTDASGGYTIPTEFSNEIEKQLADWGPMMDDNSGCRVINTSHGRPIDWPTINDTAARGGIKAENAAVTDDGGADPAFGTKQLNAYVYDSEIVRVPIELLQDSAFDIEDLLAELFGERMGRTCNDVLTVGDGSSKPQGIFTGATSAFTATATNAITGDELINLLHSIDPAYRRSPNCKWQFNDSTLAAIRKLKDGDGNYLWQMGDIRVGEPNTLLGKSYTINQAAPSMAAGATPILFGDHRKMAVRKVTNFQVVPFREKFMNQLQVGFMAFTRIDGRVMQPVALKKVTMAAS